MLRRLPDWLLIGVKSDMEIVRKMDYPRHDILLSIDSDIEYRTRLHSCKKEPETVAWIETFFKQDDIMYDVGANIGSYSLVASKFLMGSVTIYAFEPSFVTFPKLCRNIVLNGCAESIIPFQIALSDKTRVEVFNYGNLKPGGALHALGEPVGQLGDAFEPVLKQPVLSYRIDDFIRQFHVPTPNHIKIDVDGNEFQVLVGAGETLRSPLVKSVILEVQEDSKQSERIIEFLADKGLKFLSKHRYAWGGDAGPFSRSYNYVFERV